MEVFSSFGFCNSLIKKIYVKFDNKLMYGYTQIKFEAIKKEPRMNKNNITKIDHDFF